MTHDREAMNQGPQVSFSVGSPWAFTYPTLTTIGTVTDWMVWYGR